MNKRLLELKKEYPKMWLGVVYKDNQDNGENTRTEDYLIFLDEGNLFITGNRIETLDISLFKSFLQVQVLPQLRGEREKKLFNIIKDVKQYLG